MRKGNQIRYSAVGWPNSTDEGGQRHWREVEKGESLPHDIISKGKHYLYSEIGEIMTTTLARISELFKESTEMRFNSIGHLINYDMLKTCHSKMDGRKAVGIDGISKDEYGENLDENLNNLVQRLKNKSYKRNEHNH